MTCTAARWPQTALCLGGGLKAHVEVQRPLGLAVIHYGLLIPVQRQGTQLLWYLRKQRKSRGGRRESKIKKKSGLNIFPLN